MVSPGNAIVVGEIGRCLRPSCLGQIPGAGTHNAATVTDFSCLDAGVPEMTDPDTHIETPFNQIDDVIVYRHHDLDAGIQLEKRR